MNKILSAMTKEPIRSMRFRTFWVSVVPQHIICLLYTSCDKFKGKGFDAFLMSQMWDCQEDRDRIFRECKYQVVATDMLAAALPALERANLDADFLEALAELYPCLLYTSRCV